MSADRPPDATSAAFAALMRLRDEDLPLDRAAALLARGIAYPDLDVDRVLARLDRMAGEARDRLPPDRAPARTVAALNDYLFREVGLRGNDDAYYDPRNSFLNDVLIRRLGIPISLAVVYIEVARRLDFPLAAVSFLAHFLIKHAAGGEVEGDLYIDPYHGGALLTVDQLRERVARFYEGRLPFATHYLGAVTKKQVLIRMLQNLKEIYLNRLNDARHTLTIVQYLLLVAPWDLEQRRDRGLLALQIGDPALALEDLETYVKFVANDPNLPVIRGYIDALRRRFSLGS